MVFQTLHLLFKMGKEYNHQKIKDSGLSETECIICSFVISHEDCTQDDVVQAFHIDKTTIAKAMVTLEEKGFIERKQSSDDKRKKVLKLTAAGKKATLAIGDLHEKWYWQYRPGLPVCALPLCACLFLAGRKSHLLCFS